MILRNTAVLVCVATLVLSLTHLTAEPDSLTAVRAQAGRYLQMNEKGAREYAEKLDPGAAAALLSQVRAQARPRNPDVDRLSYLVAHLESQHAVALAQKRLNNLLLVIGLTITLFATFLTYVLISQRRNLIRIHNLLVEKPSGSTAGTVYRGE